MKLNRLVINNFLSFGTNVVVDLTNTAPPVLVQGVTTTPENSNGAGKSSLFEAFYWCLAGKMIREVTATEVIRKGTKACQVHAEFTFNNKAIWVLREYSESKKRLTLNVDGAVEEFHDMKQGTQRLFEILGLTPELLAMVCFSGRKFMTFSKLAPQARADLIDTLAQGSKWEEARTIAQRQAKDIGKEVDQAAAAEAQACGAVATFEELLKSKQAQALDREAANAKELTSLKQKHDEAEKVVNTAESELASLAKPVEKFEAVAATVDEISEVKVQLADVQRSIAFDTETARQQRAKADERYNPNRYDNEKNRLANELELGLCSSCGQKLPHNHDENAAIDRLAEIAETEQREEQEWRCRVDAARLDLAAAEARVQNNKNLQLALNEELEALVQLKAQYEREAQEADKRRVELESELRVSRTTLANCKHEISRIEHDTTLAVMKRDIETTEARIVEERIKAAAHAETVLKLTEDLTLAKYWAQGFNDIRFSLFNSTIQTLEDLLNAFCSQQGLDFEKIIIDTWKQTSEKKTKPEINLYVVRDGMQLSVGALSEGETQRVDLACYFAISALIEQYLGVPLELAVLDEPLTGIDYAGKELIFDILHAMSDKRQVFVIDHDANFKSLFTNTITVSKDVTSTVSIA